MDVEWQVVLVKQFNMPYVWSHMTCWCLGGLVV